MTDDTRIEQALRLLRSEDPGKRVAAIDVLCQVRHQTAVPYLLQILVEDTNETVRLIAARGLVNLTDADEMAKVLITLTSNRGESSASLLSALAVLARDLHSNCGTMSSVAMRIGIIERLLERDPARLPQEIQNIKEVMQVTSDEFRRILSELRKLAGPLED